MKIENSNINSVSPQKPEASRPVDKSARQDEVASPIGGKDKAELSDKARLLAKARAAGDTDSAERQDHVAEIKQQVDNGTYTIPLAELARRLHKLFP